MIFIWPDKIVKYFVNLGSTSRAHLVFRIKKYKIFGQFEQTKMTISRPFWIWLIRTLAEGMALSRPIDLDKIENLGSTSRANWIFPKAIIGNVLVKYRKKIFIGVGTYGQTKFWQHLPGTLDFFQKIYEFKYLVNLS